MCCHLVSLSECCLAGFLNTRLMETSATLKSQHCCAFQNKSGWNCNQRTNLSSLYSVTNSLLSSTFAESTGDSSFSERASPAHVRVLLSLHCPVNPKRRGRIPIQVNTQNPSSRTNSYFPCNPSLSFYKGSPRQDGSLGLGKKQPRICQKRLVVE